MCVDLILCKAVFFTSNILVKLVQSCLGGLLLKMLLLVISYNFFFGASFLHVGQKDTTRVLIGILSSSRWEHGNTTGR